MVLVLKKTQGVPVLEFSIDMVWFLWHPVEGFLVLVQVQRLSVIYWETQRQEFYFTDETHFFLNFADLIF